MLRLVRRRSWLGMVGLGLGLLLGSLSSLSPGIALAHGKEITIEVSSLTPDPQQPRTRLYRAFVFFTGDREPVEGAVIVLTVQRRQTGEVLPPVRLEPLNVPGFYVAQVTLPRYGTYEIRVQAEEPGAGETNFIQEVLPPALARDSGNEGGQKSIFAISIAFNWRDVANVGMRWIHSVAAGVWFGLSGLIVAAFLFSQREQRAHFLGSIYSWFPLVAAASLTLLAASGVYNAIYNSPLKPPGVFNLLVMERLPYGTPYLVAVSLKALTVLVGAGLAVAMARALKQVAALPQEGNPGITESGANRVTGKGLPLLPLAAANLVLGLTMLLSVAVMAYLHNLSHLALLVAAR